MFRKEVYQNRRLGLKKSIQSGILFFLGNTEASMNYPANTYRFRQDSDFLYFFGLDHPDFAGIIDIDSGDEIIFGNDVDMDDIIWMGAQPSVKEQAGQVGIPKTLPFGKLQDFIREAIDQDRTIHFLPPYRGHSILKLSSLLGIAPADVRSSASEELIRAVVKLRLIKEEIYGPSFAVLSIFR